MKTKSFLFGALLFAAATAQAALLSSNTAVHTKPEASAPVVSYLKEGANVSASTSSTAASAVGWMAVDVDTPFEAYVHGKDFTKSMDVRPGSNFRTAAKPEAPVLATMDAGDIVKITGVKGKWTQVLVTKRLVGYIRSSSISSAAPVPAPAPTKSNPVVAAPLPQEKAPSPAPLPVESSPLVAAPIAPAPSAAPVSGGQAIPVAINAEDAKTGLPRSYVGKFMSSRRAFAPKRPYDFQINDDAGVRFAYLDLSKLMITDSLEKYLDRWVSVYGIARNLPGTKDIVIEVETMQTR